MRPHGCDPPGATRPALRWTIRRGPALRGLARRLRFVGRPGAAASRRQSPPAVRRDGRCLSELPPRRQPQRHRPPCRWSALGVRARRRLSRPRLDRAGPGLRGRTDARDRWHQRDAGGGRPALERDPRYPGPTPARRSGRRRAPRDRGRTRGRRAGHPDPGRRRAHADARGAAGFARRLRALPGGQPRRCALARPGRAPDGRAEAALRRRGRGFRARPRTSRLESARGAGAAGAAAPRPAAAGRRGRERRVGSRRAAAAGQPAAGQRAHGRASGAGRGAGRLGPQRYAVGRDRGRGRRRAGLARVAAGGRGRRLAARGRGCGLRRCRRLALRRRRADGLRAGMGDRRAGRIRQGAGALAQRPARRLRPMGGAAAGAVAGGGVRGHRAGLGVLAGGRGVAGRGVERVARRAGCAVVAGARRGRRRLRRRGRDGARGTVGRVGLRSPARRGDGLKFVCAALVLAAHVGAWAAAPLLWFDGARPTPQAQQAVKLLLQSATHGLDPRDYDARPLDEDVARAGAGEMQPGSANAIDRHLSAAMERYLGDLHHGRVDPDQLPPGYVPRERDAFDPVSVLQAAVANDRLRQAAEEAAPQLPQYQRLRDALARYRTMDDRPWRTPLPALPPLTNGRGTPPKVALGQPWAGLAVVRERLVALGDLPRATPVAPAFDLALAQAVRAFQQLHGLASDGVIGRATLAQLEVPPAARAQQIELALERARWTPLLRSARMVMINIPEFVLRAYEVHDGRIEVRATMRAIVGKALATRTPLMVEQMRSIEFQPYWNVPPSIARGEVVPRLRRDPGYWDREGFEFVVGSRIVGELSTELLDDTIAGRARIRQRPGARNALGDIKFVFPNHENIFLHHTPAVSLFGRERRDFSHGCIRIADPLALARFVLQDQPGWTDDRIRAAMTEDEPATIRLADPVPVLIAYGTAIVEGGRIHFYDDIYGHDRRLAAALRARRPALPSE